MTKKTYHHGDLKNALIRAGIDILAREGVGGLSLRKVARNAGVSHTAPYAHFADKQALIAAISTNGHEKYIAGSRASWSSIPATHCGSSSRRPGRMPSLALRSPITFGSPFRGW